MAHTASSNGHRIATPRTSTAEGATTDHVATFWRRFNHSKYNDEMKNTLIEDVITRYENLLREHDEYVEVHQTEREYVKGTLEREQLLNSSVQRMQNIMNRDPHILVLIDGDGMIFSQTFLQQGALGGKQAAKLLHDSIIKWASASVMDFPVDSKVVVRVYANLQGLAQTCTRAGLVDSPVKVEEFARGFTCGKPLFDFTDVGAGKDRADAKMNETFKAYLYNYHCRQIVFGCSHDNGFARLLEQYTEDQEAKGRVTLLEGVPFEKELAVLPFTKVKFSGIFRNSKINLSQMDLLTGRPQRADSRVGLNGASDIFTPRSMTPVFQSPFSSNANLPSAAVGAPLSHVRTNSFASSGNTSDKEATWAVVTRKNQHKPLADLPRPAPEPVDTVKRNRAGQRVDIPGDYDRDEVQRIKKLKSCNQHYIGIGCCHYNAGREDKCPHNHDFTFSAADLKTLRVVAKETPCKKGHECDDPKCIYGHICPFPLATEGSMRGIGCLNGEACRFPKSMHNMDKVPVKMIRTSGMF